MSSNANPERRSDVSEACRSTHGALKKKLLVADDEDNIFTEKKAATCYYDTVNKLKEIEKLSLNVKLEKSPSAIRTKRELVSDAVASNEITTAENSESRCAEKTAPTPASKTDSILTSVKEAKALLPEQAAEKYETNCSESNCVSKPQLSLKSNFNGVSNKLDSQQGELEKNETKRETIPVTSASAATTAVALKPSSENRTSFENDAVVQTKLQAIKETLKNCNKTNSKLKKKRSRRPRSRYKFVRCLRHWQLLACVHYLTLSKLSCALLPTAKTRHLLLLCKFLLAFQYCHLKPQRIKITMEYGLVSALQKNCMPAKCTWCAASMWVFSDGRLLHVFSVCFFLGHGLHPIREVKDRKGSRYCLHCELVSRCPVIQYGMYVLCRNCSRPHGNVLWSYTSRCQENLRSFLFADSCLVENCSESSPTLFPPLMWRKLSEFSRNRFEKTDMTPVFHSTTFLFASEHHCAK